MNQGSFVSDLFFAFSAVRIHAGILVKPCIDANYCYWQMEVIGKPVFTFKFYKDCMPLRGEGSDITNYLIKKWDLFIHKYEEYIQSETQPQPLEHTFMADE